MGDIGMNKAFINNVKSLLGFLREKGFKVTKPSSLGECVEVSADAGDFVFFLYIFNGDNNNLIIKITTNPRSCQESLLDPKGLFIISNSIETAKEKILDKIERLKRISKVTKI